MPSGGTEESEARGVAGHAGVNVVSRNTKTNNLTIMSLVVTVVKSLAQTDFYKLEYDEAHIVATGFFFMVIAR